MPRSGIYHFPYIPWPKYHQQKYSSFTRENQIGLQCPSGRIFQKKLVHSSIHCDKKFWVINSKTLERILRVKAKAKSRRVRYRMEAWEMFHKRSYVSHIQHQLWLKNLQGGFFFFFLVQIVLRSLFIPVKESIPLDSHNFVSFSFKLPLK